MSILLVLMFVFTMIGCSAPDPPETPATVPTDEPSETVDEIYLRAVTFEQPSKIEDSIVVYHEFVNRVNEAAEGELRIEIIGGPEVIPLRDQADAMASGVVDMVMNWGVHSGLVPGADLPSFSHMKPWEERENGFFDLMDKSHQTAGIKYLGRTATESGFYIYSTKRIETLDDFKGLRIRSHAGYDPFLQYLGCTTIHMDIGEIYTGLERGVVQAAPYSPYGYDLGLHEVCDYILDEPFNTAHSTIHMINLDVFNSLPVHLQVLIEETAEQIEYDMVEICRELISNERQKMKDAGVEFLKLSPEDSEKYFMAAEGIRLHAIHKRENVTDEMFKQAVELMGLDDWYWDFIEGVDLE